MQRLRAQTTWCSRQAAKMSLCDCRIEGQVGLELPQPARSVPISGQSGDVPFGLLSQPGSLIQSIPSMHQPN